MLNYLLYMAPLTAFSWSESQRIDYRLVPAACSPPTVILILEYLLELPVLLRGSPFTETDPLLLDQTRSRVTLTCPPFVLLPSTHLKVFLREVSCDNGPVGELPAGQGLESLRS